jgi:hypothetical protein
MSFPTIIGHLLPMRVTVPMLGMSILVTAMTIGTISQTTIMFVVFVIMVGVLMFSFANIYRAYKDCIKNKKSTINALNFQTNLLENLWNLEYELKNRTYKIGKSICFLTHSPKLREVFASNFKDRIVHHLLINEIESYYEKKFIYDVYNNRKNKGIHSAIKRAKSFMNSIGFNGYYLQLDIKGFFYSLDKNILFKQIYQDIQKSNINNKDKILWLCNKIIYHNPTKNFVFKGNIKDLQKLPPHKSLFKIPNHKGLPIGNLTSQFFANIYMNRFDHFVKRNLKIKHYIRYVDDFVLFHNSKKILLTIKQKIADFLFEKLQLRLRDDFKIKSFNEGLDFLGYIIRPNYILVRKRVVNNYKFKKAFFLQKYEKLQGNIDLKQINHFMSVQASFLGHLKHANSYNLIRKVGQINEEKYIKLITNNWT